MTDFNMIMSELGTLEDAIRTLNHQREQMDIFEALGEYTVTEETLTATEDLIFLLEIHEKRIRNIRKNLTMKCRSYNVKRLIKYLESEKRVWAGIP